MLKKITAIIMIMAVTVAGLSYTPKTMEASVTSSGDSEYEWIAIGNGTGSTDGDGFYYRSDTNVSVVNAQYSFGTENGIYVTVADGISSVSINGVSDSGYAVQGAGTLLYLSALTENINEVVITHASGTSTIYIKNTNVSEEETTTVEETTTLEETTAEAEGEGWSAWTSDGSYSWTSVSAYDSGWTLSNQDIGTVWWSIQTQSPTTTLKTGTEYQVSFTLTAPYPKAFVVDASNDDYKFTETGNGSWTGNSDGTYSYNYVGTYTPTADGTNVRVSIGYESSSTYDTYYYTQGGSYTFKLSGYSLSTVEDDEETTTESQAEAGQPGSSDLTAPDGVSAYNYYAQGKGYEIKFTEVTDAVSYNIYMDNDTDVAANVSGTDQYVAASAFADYADGEVHSLYVAAVDSDGNVSLKSDAASVRITEETDSSSDPTDITRIYVVTNEGTKGGSDITKASKTAASLTIISEDGSVNTVSGDGTIKLRGNSTSLADKKAYNISFSSKQKVFTNASKGKKWCLLANAFDKTLMRNKLAMDFGATLGNVAAPEEHYADLYVDGVYMGNYVISEPAENGRAGVDYDDETDDTQELLFEVESSRTEDGVIYYTTGLGMRFATEDLEDIGGTSSAKYSSWIQNLETFETALKNTSSDAVFDYIDVDSFVDMYIVNELFNTVDFGYSSVKFYIQEDEEGNATIVAGPLWDFDLSSGNSSVAEARQYDKFRCQEVNVWFYYLMQNETFKDLVVTKFTEMQAEIQNLYQDNSLGTNAIDTIYSEIYESRVRNYTSTDDGGAGWSESDADSAEIIYYPYSYIQTSPYNTYDYDQHVEYLREWLQNRNEWMCTQWDIDYTSVDEEDTVTISSDIDVTGYQMTASLNGVDGSMGMRVVYQAEDTIEGQTASEIGLVYGLVYGDDPITTDDVLYGSDNSYVVSYAATETGILSQVMGDSETATYYVRTMSCGSTDESVSVSTDAYTSTYYVRAYAILEDGSVVYSDVSSYTVYDIADYIYQNNLVSNYRTYDYLYTKILGYVNEDYQEGEYDWGTTVVKP